MSAVTVAITGHLANDPPIRTTTTGRSVTDFTVIGNDRRYDETKTASGSTPTPAASTAKPKDYWC